MVSSKKLGNWRTFKNLALACFEITSLNHAHDKGGAFVMTDAAVANRMQRKRRNVQKMFL